jgi:ABC-type phosphate transport system substrate-binding protein
MVILLFSGCAFRYKESDASLSFTEEDFPRLDGSTATIPLAEAAAAVLMGIDREDTARFVNFYGTDRSFRNLIERQVDLLIVYEPSFYAVGLIGDMDKLHMAPIGKDGLVFSVNIENPVENLTIQQVRDIFAGRIKNWNEVGGYDAPIIPLQRNVTAGSHTMMLSLLMEGIPFMPPRQDFVFGSMESMLEAVGDNISGVNAIGYHVFFYVSEMNRNPNVRIISIDGVTPTQRTISTGEYPLTNYFCAVIRADEPQSSSAYRMFHWLQGEQAQRIIYSEGYAPIYISN